jgi:hypothetical protein
MIRKNDRSFVLGQYRQGEKPDLEPTDGFFPSSDPFSPVAMFLVGNNTKACTCLYDLLPVNTQSPGDENCRRRHGVVSIITFRVSDTFGSLLQSDLKQVLRPISEEKSGKRTIMNTRIFQKVLARS